MADLNVHIPNAVFRLKVVEAYRHEPYEAIMALIIDLVEEIAGDGNANEELKTLIDLIDGYIEEDREE